MKRKMLKKRMAAAAACVSLLIGISITGRTVSAEGTSGYMDTKNSVVAVQEHVELDGVVVESDEIGPFYGSGFFVGKEGEAPHYLITNYHVVSTYIQYGSGQLSILEDDEGGEHTVKSFVRVYYDYDSYEEAYIVGYDEIADVAVLRLESPTDQREPLSLCPPTEDMVGAKVYAVGYPGLSDNIIIDTVTRWGSDDLTFTSGIISRLVTTSGSGVKNIQIDVALSGGNSGGRWSMKMEP